jgi:hypothetical protein
MSAGGRSRPGLAALGSWLYKRGVRLEPTAYALYAAAWTLYAASLFFASMHGQIEMLYAALEGDAVLDQMKLLGSWSAPLDDVFIHFDFARATARGYPFEWSQNNGYSSGGTSLLYPFVLALGYRLGFMDLKLMLWAGMLACICVFALLLAARRLFRQLPVWTSYLAPPALLCVGVLDWTLFSGMEVALLLAVWAGALVMWTELLDLAREQAPSGQARLLRRAVWLGLAGAAMVATRPESVTALAVFVLGAAWVVLRNRGLRAVWRTLLATALPGALVIVGHAAANRWLTGEYAAAGALTKLELYDPFLTPAEVFGAWWFHVKYQLFRVSEYHLADDASHGWIVWGLALAALPPRSTRRYALLLGGSAVTWVLLVALNGQVRWQNERYSMPALAWLLLAAALGLGALLSERWRWLRRGWWVRGVSVTAALVAVTLFLLHQRPRFREQVWFFGRACRNILEQHVRTGLRIRHQLSPTPRRVLVGDAGAIPYAADLPCLDIIGLGGFRGLPFARANRLGVGAAIELIDRLAPDERPDLLAVYPSWWAEFPLWFGRRIAEVPVHENVICGGASKVLYGADWSALSGSAWPLGLSAQERIVDELDFADLVSEKEHDYALSMPRVGHVTMKLLPQPEWMGAPVWDAGRSLGPEVAETFELRGFAPARPARLLLRAAPAQAAAIAVFVGEHRLGSIEMKPRDSWQQLQVVVPSEHLEPPVAIRIEGVSNTRELYHLWAVQKQ